MERGKKANRGGIKLQSFFTWVMPEPNTGCWLWIGELTKKGYGNTNMSTGDYKLRGSHRISYYLHNGPFDYKLCVCHTCDNPSCVNPQHLFLATSPENTEDMRRKGRASKGSHRPTSKLKESDIIDIRNKRQLGKSVIKLSKEYSICRTTVYGILHNKYWAHV